MCSSHLLLIHNPALWRIIDDWVTQLPPEDFQEILPLLRRAFAKFSAPERQRMLNLAKNGVQLKTEQNTSSELITEQAEIVLPTLQLLLGLKK